MKFTCPQCKCEADKPAGHLTPGSKAWRSSLLRAAAAISKAESQP